MVKSFTGLQFTQCPDYYKRSGELSVGEQMPSGMHHYEKYTRTERKAKGWQDGDPPQIRPCSYEEHAARDKNCALHGVIAYGT